MPRRTACALLVLLTAIFATPAGGDEATAEDPWYRVAADGGVVVTLFFFWSETCPHCIRARPVVADIATARPWLALRSVNIDESDANRALLRGMAAAVGRDIEGVPAFLLCGRMFVGFGTASESGRFLEEIVDRCRIAVEGYLAEAEDRSVSTAPVRMGEPTRAVELPFVGAIDAASLSLPVLTVVLGGLDAFNPCAFFVLFFLLSLLVQTRDRGRMLLIGGTFLLFSGVMYFAFMAAWLNLFLVLSGVEVVTAIAGLTAVALALVNIKDFVRFKQGPSLSIPDRAKPRLVSRMKGLLSADNLPAMLAGTVALAIAANAYELLCTSGLPMIYTRALTLNDLPTTSFYLYLALYNAIYVLPLLAITLVFVVTLGGRRLSETGGRALKLLSGLLMLGLGLVLLIAPPLLDNLLTAIMLLIAALAGTGLAMLIDRRLRRRVSS
ncbi:MAG: thioredoxin family protein [Minwuiales bacterium]|nr:thioredoxin family protein [Minwuiales bacterium]